MQKTFDGVYFFLGMGKWPSRCQIRIYEDLDSRQHHTRVMVVASQYPNDPEAGSSIVNCVPQLANEIRAWQSARQKARGDREQVDEFTWYEHLAGRDEDDPDTWDIVTFKAASSGDMLGEPRWKHLTRSDIESAVGESLPERFAPRPRF